MLQWCCKSFKIRQYFHFKDGDLFHCYKLVPNQYHLDQWLILTNDRRIHSQNYFIYFETITDSIITAPWPMTDMMNDRYLHHQNEIIFFYFETTTASFQRLDQLLMWWMIHRYVHPQNEIIFFYFKTIIASFKHLDQWMIDISILKMTLFYFISKLLQHHISTLTNDWYDEW